MREKVITVTMNPCIDKTMIFDSFTYGGMNRAVSVRTDFSGKGINVSRVLTNLGYDTVCMGFNYAAGGETLERELDASGVRHDFVTVEGTLRTNVKMVVTDTMTELNESGGYVDSHSLDMLLEKIEQIRSEAGIFVLSGSVPKGVPKDIYRTIIELIKRGGDDKKVILDAEGSLLAEGLKAAPYAVKPNLYELETAFGVKLSSRDDILGICMDIINNGTKIVCVSMGAEGALITDGCSLCCRPALGVTVRGLQGAGDSLVAGMCAGIMDEKPLDEILKYALAAAAGSVVREGTLLCEAEGFREMYRLL